jgi:sigma-E factor negative regulatory protein RseC
VIEAVGTVREVDGQRVLVEVERRSACGGCESTGNCGVSALGGWFSRGTSRLRLRTSLPIRAGEAVVIGLEESALLRASLLLYLLPIVALIAGAVGGTVLGGSRGDWPAIAGGLLGFAAGLAVSRRQSAALPWGAGVAILRRHGEPVNVPLDPGPVRTTTRSL